MHMNEFIHVAEKSSLGIAINRIQDRSVERVYVNSAFKSMLGYQDAKDVTSIPLTETFKYQSDLNDYYLRPNDLRTSCRIRSDGNELWLTSYRETMEFDGAAYQVSWSIDMTEDHQNSASQRRIEKYTLLGELTENLAHEIAQPLTVITYGLFNIENRLKKLAGTDQTAINSLVERFGRISDQIDVLSSIIHRTRQFAKNTELALPICIGSCIRRSLDFIMREFTLSDIVVQKSLEPISVGPVGNQVELQQVLMNLLKNAKEAYDINEDVEKRVVKIEVFTAHDGSVTISVIDYAGDIPDEVAARIFDRYFTTKQGTGTGLGLHISRQIIEEMGGTLSLNRQGCCNSFDILFPKQALSHVSDQ